jgi:hypothetical protein
VWVASELWYHASLILAALASGLMLGASFAGTLAVRLAAALPRRRRGGVRRGRQAAATTPYREGRAA